MIYARACQLLPNAAIAASRSPGSRDIDVRPAYPARIYFRPASSRIAASAARPLSVSVYAPLSRLCAMNPRMTMDWPGQRSSLGRSRVDQRGARPGDGRPSDGQLTAVGILAHAMPFARVDS